MTPPRLIVFVCLHGSAKSLIAAELSRKLAAAKGLDLRFDSAGTEPDAEVPPHVVAGLNGEGVDARGRKPQPATRAALQGAELIVSFGPDLTGVAPPGVPIEHWDDLPQVADGYARARDAIQARIEGLMRRF